MLNLTVDNLLRRIAPSVLVEGPPHERETCVRERDVRCHVLCRPSPRVVDNDPELGMRQVEAEPIRPQGERYFNSYVVIYHVLMFT